MKTIKSLLLALSMSPMLATAAGMEGNHAHHDAAIKSAAGQPGDSDKVTRTVNVAMRDTMRFTPEAIVVKAGETVRFVVRNLGKVDHEMIIGTASELQAHAQMMRNMPADKHAGPNQVTLAPGQQGTLVWQFARPETVDFACLVPGHFEAGMVGKIVVR
ncbi:MULTISPECIES: cupredoxin domain-containing protein [Cupriavidus]|uniref:Cupredoxin family protein n=1 Tax=Cupriavidus gilardii TaxID=82541 RepID=A0A849BBR2_9BURK|nr:MULTISPECIES: cupredoxin family protein [Cupriavidus]KAB0595218.1 cupredoxin family protein [Cupriavidus gilardii]MCT9015593.1 cupredoxin family protein [Cupriavidus gilardii]MCT9055363.1 cupredoxin family protein [Cupriavidus gilardii]NNH13280.1 cupredoxin family protein [Cupriavidus gilardii]USE81761.1 cupredoxin family protein [Cupriavidus gilardii]